MPASPSPIPACASPITSAITDQALGLVLYTGTLYSRSQAGVLVADDRRPIVLGTLRPQGQRQKRQDINVQGNAAKTARKFAMRGLAKVAPRGQGLHGDAEPAGVGAMTIGLGHYLSVRRDGCYPTFGIRNFSKR